MDDGRPHPEVGRRISTLFFRAIPSSQYPPATASAMSAALCVADSLKKLPTELLTCSSLLIDKEAHPIPILTVRALF